MSKFIEKTGSDVASVMLSVSHSTAPLVNYTTNGGGGNGNDLSDRITVKKKRLDMQYLRTVEQFTKANLDLNDALDILSSYSLSVGVEFSFMGKRLDDKDYGLRVPMRTLLAVVRKWLIMFGFVAIHNPDLRATRLLERLRNEGLVDVAGEGSVTSGVTPTTGTAASTLEQPFETLRSIRQLIHDVIKSPKKAEQVERATIGAPETPVEASTTGAAEGETRLVPRKRRPDVKLRVVHFPQYTSLQMPSAMAVPVRVGAGDPNGDDDGGDVDAEIAAWALGKRKRLTFVDGDSTGEGDEEAATAQGKYVRTVQEAIIGLRQLCVVNLNDGEFELEIDTLRQERRLVFLRRDSRTGACQPDPDVVVYVLDDMMPNDDGSLNTKIDEVMKLKVELDAARSNAKFADYKSTHIIQPVEHVPIQNDMNVDHMVDQALYGGDDNSEVARQRRQEIEQSGVNRFVMGVEMQRLNNKVQGEFVDAILSEASANPYPGVASIEAQRRRDIQAFIKEDYWPVPQGYKIAQRQMPVPLIDQAQLIYYYRQALAKLAGVPLSLIDSGSSFTGKSSRGGTSSSGSSMSDASAGVGDKRLMLAISEDRRRLTDFTASLWNSMYREADNRTLTQALERSTAYVQERAEYAKLFVKRVQARLEQATEAAETETLNDTLGAANEALTSFESRLRVVQTQLLEISSMPFRFEVKFTALLHIPSDQIQMALAGNAMSELEAANALRVGIGMEPFTKEEFEELKRSKEEEELQRQDKEASIAEKHALKPNVPSTAKGGGGAAAKRTKS